MEGTNPNNDGMIRYHLMLKYAEKFFRETKFQNIIKILSVEYEGPGNLGYESGCLAADSRPGKVGASRVDADYQARQKRYAGLELCGNCGTEIKAKILCLALG